MNTIFVDLFDKKEKKKDSENNKEDKEKSSYNLQSKFFKMAITKDFTSNKFNKNILLLVDSSFLDLAVNKKENKKENKKRNNSFSKMISECYLKHFLKKEYKKDEELFVVFSKAFDSEKKYKKYLRYVFDRTLKKINISEIDVKNEMLKHDLVYIDNMLNKLNIKPNNANILLVLNNMKDFREDKLVEYIKKYKYVDILRLNGISKREEKVLLEKVEKINNEYGSTIEVIERKNIIEYSVYLFYSTVDIARFKGSYIINKEAKFLNICDEEEDTLSLSFRTYMKNKYILEALFNRLNYDLKRFSKNKLGNLFLTK